MSVPSPDIIRVNCGELCTKNDCTASEINLLHKDVGELASNITIGYAKFIENADELPERILDLLQIAAYVFCGDRMANRGLRDSVNYESWARSFEYNIPVLDMEFWNNKKIKRALNDALIFMTGDRCYNFNFFRTEKNPAEISYKQLSIFTENYINIREIENIDIMLFSGGLDSLAGAVQRLSEEENRSLCLISHKSNRSVIHTQDSLVYALKEKYGNRVKHYGFECCNHNGLKSKDETQRTRMFLFSAIAFSICYIYGKHSFYVYENGITSLNLSKQADLINARASRTTHPKTLGLLRKLYKNFDPLFDIIAPYYNKTKAEVVEIFRKYHMENIITSSVSCSTSWAKRGQSPHCGCCSQCIDRRFSLYSVGLDEYDGEYVTDFIYAFPDDDKNETKQRIYNTLRLAYLEEISSKEAFIQKYPDELVSVVSYWQGSENVDDKLDEIYDLVCRYGKSVIVAATAMRNKNDDLTRPINKNSLLGILSDRQYMNTPFYNRVVEIDAILKRYIPDVFHMDKPKNENDFNAKLHGLLNVQEEFLREYPVLQFGLSSYRADQSQGKLLIESKYLRGKTSPSIASEGIAADITKIPESYGILFVIYDPERQISDDYVFIKAFESKRKDCFVRVYR